MNYSVWEKFLTKWQWKGCPFVLSHSLSEATTIEVAISLRSQWFECFHQFSSLFNNLSRSGRELIYKLFTHSASQLLSNKYIGQYCCTRGDLLSSYSVWILKSLLSCPAMNKNHCPLGEDASNAEDGVILSDFIHTEARQEKYRSDQEDWLILMRILCKQSRGKKKRRTCKAEINIIKSSACNINESITNLSETQQQQQLGIS